MAQANLNKTPESVDTGNDNIVIMNMIEDIPGGKTLDVTGFTPEVIKAGHLIIVEDATGELKPMPISGSAYASLPANHSYKGVLIGSILTAKPLAAIMVRGSVNEVASPFAVPSGAKTALSLIRFTKD